VSWIGTKIEHCGEFPHGNDARSFMAAEREQLFVAGHEEFGLLVPLWRGRFGPSVLLPIRP